MVGAAARKSEKALELEQRGHLISMYQKYKGMRKEWLRRLIIDQNRIDILATAVLGYEVQPYHLAMMRYQFQHPNNLQLAFRGGGKSTVCNITKCIHLLVKNPNLRILLSSKTTSNAEAFLKEIKAHLEGNQVLIELFGEYYDPRKVTKWDNREIEVLPRTHHTKEASITCVGVDATIVSKHYDVFIDDDLVDEDNSRTKYMRDKTRSWYYQTLDPCLEPPDSRIPHRGEHHRLGTRYHYDDLYGHLIKHELAKHHQIIPALDEHQRSPWPEKYPPRWFEEKRRNSGIIIFNAQYQCDTEAMKGEIFQYDHCQVLEDADYPSRTSLRVFMGIDLAISEKDTADKFAIVVLGMDTVENYYVLDFFEGQLRFNQQTDKIIRDYNAWEVLRGCIETNNYQAAQYQNLKDRDKNIRMIPVNQDKDKISRAWKLTPLFENKRVFFKRSHQLLIEHLVLFPNHRYKDLFDAFDLAVRASHIKGKKRRRASEPGLI
jgi:predicted phage terminase large subunit-like protein